MTPLQHHDKRIDAGMTLHAELMLNLIRDALDRSMDSDMMYLNHMAVSRQIGSGTTMHRAAKWLRLNKYIVLTQDEKDGRIKHCTITAKGTKYLADAL